MQNKSDCDPSQLSANGPFPERLTLKSTSATAIAERYGLRKVGPDRPVSSLGPLSRRVDGQMTYLASAEWMANLPSETTVILTTDALAKQITTPHTLLVTTQSPKTVFYEIFQDLAHTGQYRKLTGRVSPRAQIARSAIISDHVWVEDDADIGPGVVLYPNTYVGRGVVIKANATIGGDGFEPVTLSGKRSIVNHAGGVWLAEGVHVGSSTTIDRGLFGEFTFLGSGTLVDNLVHIAHSVRLGSDCSVVACAEISGSVTVEDGVWIGPGARVNQLLTLGHHAFLGTGSVVTKSVPAHALMVGVPARAIAAVCVCRRQIDLATGKATCPCGKQIECAVSGEVICRIS